MKIHIRQEQAKDHQTVFQIVEDAFEEMKYSSHREQFIVEKLWKDEAFIPELSLVAELNGELVGYIILTKIKIDNGQQLFDALTLGPVAVLPRLHKKGIGSQLINEVHKRAKNLGHQVIVLLGHKDYYPRFGYEPMRKYNISLPFEANPEASMVIGLTPDALNGISGKVIYSKPFLE